MFMFKRINKQTNKHIGDPGTPAAYISGVPYTLPVFSNSSGTENMPMRS